MYEKNTFTPVYDRLMLTPKLNFSQKFFISYLLRWQSSNQVCYEQTTPLAKKLGCSRYQLNRLIISMTEFEFFKKTNQRYSSADGKITEKRVMSIDKVLFENFLESEIEENLVSETTDLIPENSEGNDLPANAETVLNETENFLTEYQTNLIKGLTDIFAESTDCLENLINETKTYILDSEEIPINEKGYLSDIVRPYVMNNQHAFEGKFI